MAIVVGIITIPHPADTDCSFKTVDETQVISQSNQYIYNIALENFQGQMSQFFVKTKKSKIICEILRVPIETHPVNSI